MLTYMETNRLLLRVCTPNWCNEVLRFYQDNRAIFQPYDPACPNNYYTSKYQYNSLAYEYQSFLENRSVRYYVFEKSRPQHIIGTISFASILHGFVNSAVIGYKLDQHYQHRGYAFEALRQGIETMFGQERLHRITAYIMPDNQPSIRLILRLGFSYEGTARDYALIQGRWEDHSQYSLVNGL